MSSYSQAEKIQTQLQTISQRSEQFLRLHNPHESVTWGSHPLTGSFSLYRNRPEPDLYGMIDAVYVLFILGRLEALTDRPSRQQWANRILACQDEDGWFTRRNLRGHSREHATAYAIGALGLLATQPAETYIDQIRPIPSLLPILTDEKKFHHWITHLQFRYLPQDVLRKNVGWHHIWRGSHIGGGIAAIIGTLSHLLEEWWPKRVQVDEWFSWYFDWLDAHVNPKTGMWQRAFWNWLIRKPTLIDMGGAVHFYWVYEARKRPLPYPESIMESTLAMQKDTGLYKDHPFCIDLDGNYCVIRAYLQLDEDKQKGYRRRVYQSALDNFEAIVTTLSRTPLDEIYDDLHGLPGALAALTECRKLPGFPYNDSLTGWQHPLDSVWWL